MAVLVMVFLMVAPPLTVEAASTSDYFILGEPEHDLINGYMKYGYAQGYGKTKYKSIVVNFTSVCTHGERIEITSMDGFNYERDLSNNVTVVINMPEGKTLPQVCGFIRKIKFYNCDSANNKIKFTIGREEVHYMTLYCEDTGHYYQYIPFKSTEGTIKTTMIKLPDAEASYAYGSWQYSYYRALSMSYEGLQGYMCTITKSAEDIFLYKNANKIGWLGGTRMGRGAAATKNGIRYYKSFTMPTSTSDKIQGYWYWASGPEASMKLGNGTGADGQFSVGIGYYNKDKPKSGCTTTFYTDTNAKKYYYNWNDLEPNNSYSESPLTTECAMTTLKIGAGPNTSSVIPSGYSWNDIQPLNANYEGLGGPYEATGFFVEYGDAEFGLKEGTKATLIAEDSETSVLTHNWLYVQGKVSNQDANVIHAYCTKEGKEKCSYYGSETAYAKTLDVALSTLNMAFKKDKVYNLASITGTSNFKSLTGGTVNTSIQYYKAPSEGAISGGSPLDSAPKDVGFYYAEISATNANGTSTAKAVSAFKIYNDMAQVNAEGLNNLLGKKDTATENHVSYRVVEGTSTATTDLRVKHESSDDRLTLYRLAEMKFEDGKLTDVEWVPAVIKWLENEGSAYASIARTPRDLGEKASGNKYAEFYDALFKYIKDTTATEANLGITGVTIPVGATIADCLKLVGNEDGSCDYTTITKSDDRKTDIYENIKFGIYAISATVGDSDKTYNLTTATVVPEKNGPSEFYYVKPSYEVTVKEVSAAIEKGMRNINAGEEKFLQVSTYDIGDTIEFEIDFGLPDYAQKTGLDPASLENGFDTKNGYNLKLVDYMASGYTLKENAYGEGQTFKLAYRYNYKVNEEDTAQPAEEEIRIDQTVIKSKKTKTASEGENVDCKLMKLSTSQKDGDPTFTIDFDPDAVRTWKDDRVTITVDNEIRTITSITGFVIYYQATTNGKAVVGKDENTNTAEIIFELHGGESEDKIGDTTHGFTYAVNIVKVDGAKVNDDSPVYLDDTYFKLYKQVAAFDSHHNVVFNKLPAGTSEGYDNAEDQFVAEHPDSDYRVLENHNIINPDDDDAVIQVTSYFMPYTNESGTFTTAADSKLGAGYILTVAPEFGELGKTVTGLGPGNYILVEAKPKTGYNELAEDIYFEINEQSDKEARIRGNALNKAEFREALGYGTLFTTTGTSEQITAAQEAATEYVSKFKRYLEDPTNNKSFAPTYSSDGTVKLKVLNFKGLTLPSTGGIGILIFIIIGVTMMASVIFILIRNYKKLQNNM